MRARPDAASPPAPKSLTGLNRIIAAARPSPGFSERAVLGEGPIGAAIAFVGEQPGDREDLVGRPFVGPAGKLLDAALSRAGIDRNTVYLTNAVKRFKFEQRGKKRLHKRPTTSEVLAEKAWLDAELEFVGPRLIVALGATAVRALAGEPLAIAASRGPADFGGRAGFITVHPSALLRIPDAAARCSARTRFVRDMRRVRALAAKRARATAR